ncbi:MAG: DUF885 domain-containing protein [Gammaproteobacteria bacterium]|nr:DUF885 domain-containing protein [Gammaproteobacteria bacterium]MDH5652526.1 DUF885 domain-containing protein [Gammaproteobacteria bacterium]
MSNLSQVIDTYYRAWFRFFPEVAVDLGIEGYAEKLRPYGEDERGALIVLHEKLLSTLEELDESDLSEDQQIDLALMRGRVLLDMKDLNECDWRVRDPGRYLPVHAIYQLTVRPVADPKAAFTARLQAIPDYLRGARAQLKQQPEQIPSIWLESAVTEATQGAIYFRSLEQHPQLARYGLAGLLEEAAHALEDYARFLELDLAPLARGSFARGLDYYNMLLTHRHHLDVDANTLHKFGEQLFEKTLRELYEVTRRLRGDENVPAMAASLQAKSAANTDLISTYREVMQAAKQFVIDKQLVSIPAKEELLVVETPIFLQHQIPFAAYLDPAPNDPDQQGHYYVTPAKGEKPGEHNQISLQHTCVHEAWPGHHLQFVTANLSHTSNTLPRLLNASATLYEGWALYSEQLMHEQGFLSAPESAFVLLKDRLWRALRVMIDVEIQTRGLSVSMAAERMQSLLGFSRGEAMAELSWYSQAPGVPMGYAVGWALINATRERLKSVEKDFNLKQFHDQLLSAGSVALPFVIRRRFGKPLWESVRREVFNK